MKILARGKNVSFYCLFFCLLTSGFYAQEQPSAALPANETSVAVPQKAQPGTFFFTIGPTIIINTDQNLQSAPSPVLFSGGFGAHIPFAKRFTFSPHVSFFMNYYLWTGTAALPAEIENRTALVPSLMIDLPLAVLIRTKNTVTSLGIGAGFLLRYGFLATGVPASDAHHTDLINDYFWNAARWFYPMAQVSWDYVFPSGLAAGAGVRLYFPVSAAFDKKASFAQGMIIAASVRLHLSKNLFSGRRR